MSTPSEISATCKQELAACNKFFYTRNCVDLSTNVAIGVRYNKLPSLPELYAALANLIESYPPLGLQVYAEGDADANCGGVDTTRTGLKPLPPRDIYAAQVSPIDFSAVVFLKESVDIQDKAAIDLFLGARFEYGSLKKLLWKVFILKDNWLVFNYDHTLFDGISGISVHNHIISFLNRSEPMIDNPFDCSSTFAPRQITDSKNLNVINIYKPLEKTWSFAASRAIDTKIKPNIKYYFNAIVKKLSLNPLLLGRLNQFENSSKYVIQKNQFADNIFVLEIPQNNIMKLIKMGKDHGNISMNTLLCSLFAAATRGSFVLSEQSINFFFPVNARSIGNVPQDSIGIMIKGEEVVTPVLKNELFSSSSLDLSKFWEFASAIQSDMSYAINSPKGYQNFCLLNEADLLSLMKSKEGKPPTSVFGHSNLGVQFKENASRTAEKNHYSIIDALFYQSNVFSNCFTLSSISTLDSGLKTSIVYPNELKQEMETLISNVQKYLQQLLQAE